MSVVVDLTDLGREVEAGCAPGDPTTGREALLAAGFTATDDSYGMICAIDAAPDPCPTAFTGSYWSYWSAEPGGEWTAYTEGADTTDPVPGSLEGWRYNDGSTGPGASPVDVLAAATSTNGTAADTATAAADDGTGNETAGVAASDDPGAAASEAASDIDETTTTTTTTTTTGDAASEAAGNAVVDGTGKAAGVATAIGVGALALLVVAASVVVVRRRRG